MLKIGVTGGIGSGKSTVCKIFESLNISVYYSDHRAKELMNSDPNLINKLKTEFGEIIYDDNGKLQPGKLANIVFSDSLKLNKLNGIVHPYVLNDFETWCNEHISEKYVILESAIIFESKLSHLLDEVIVVDAPVDVKINRIMIRDKVDRNHVLSRMNKQFRKDDLKGYKFRQINNDGKQPLIAQILPLHMCFSGQ